MHSLDGENLVLLNSIVQVVLRDDEYMCVRLFPLHTIGEFLMFQ